MSYTDPNQNPVPETFIPSTNDTEAVQKLKVYQAFIFSIPICFTFIVLFVFYVIYLRRRNNSVDWSSLGMRGGSFVPAHNLSMIELGMSKELREMLPIVIFKESFSINDLQCSVCLGDYQADEKFQQIPACGHTFHMDCIDLWLTSLTTCPLCPLSLIPKFPLHRSHQTSDEGGSASQPKSHSTSTETLDHTVEGQDGNCDSTEVSKETQENDRNIIGTSDTCCNCRLG